MSEVLLNGFHFFPIFSHWVKSHSIPSLLELDNIYIYVFFHYFPIFSLYIHIFIAPRDLSPLCRSRCWCRRTTLCWAKVPWWRSRRPACSTWRAGWSPVTTGDGGSARDGETRNFGKPFGMNFWVFYLVGTFGVDVFFLMGWCSFAVFTKWFIRRSLRSNYVEAGCCLCLSGLFVTQKKCLGGMITSAGMNCPSPKQSLATAKLRYRKNWQVEK